MVPALGEEPGQEPVAKKTAGLAAASALYGLWREKMMALLPPRHDVAGSLLEYITWCRIATASDLKCYLYGPDNHYQPHRFD